MTEEQLTITWKAVLKEIEGHLSTAVFKTWFKHSSLIDLKPGEATISVENDFAQKSIEKFTQERLFAALNHQTSFQIKKVKYQVIESKTELKKSPSDTGLFSHNQSIPVYEEIAESASKPGLMEPFLASNLNPKYTFHTFIVGNKNRLAHAAAQAVAEQPGAMYNPLYLYGGVGLGKTHLMQAIGNEVIGREPQKRVLYVSCEHFTNEFTASIRSAKIDSFKKKYRNIDIFLVDDIQFIAGKEGTQEEFFHTFNALYQTNKQIIITSDKAPGDIKDLEERLSSRFSSGMIADMQLPDLETRQAILQAKCEERGIRLPDQILLYIADIVETNIRELEGALTRVSASLNLNKSQPSIEEVRLILKDFVGRKPLKKSGIEHLRQIVCEFYGVEYKDIKGQRRQQELVKPRQILMYLLKNELGLTFPTIGREIGGRDHTTAMYAVGKIEKEMKKSPDLLEELQQLKELFYAGIK